MSQPHKSLGLRLLEGVHSNVLGQAAVFAVNLAVTPVLVHRLGADGYALYTLMWTLLGYLMMLTAGTGAATYTFAARYRGQKGATPFGALLRRTLVFQAAISVVGALALLAGRGWISLHWLNIQGGLADNLPRVFACVAVAAPAYFILQLCVAVLYGTQHFDAYNLFQALQSTVVALGGAFLVTRGAGIREIAALFVWAHVILAAAGLWMVRGALRARSPSLQGEGTEFVRFSGKSFLSQGLGIFISQGDRVVIGSYLPLAQMGYYVIASNLAQKFSQVAGTIHAIAFPILTELHGSGERERLKRFYLKATEISLFLIVPLTVLACVLMPQFTTLWLGQDFSAASTWPFRLILLANFASVATSLPNGVATGMGEPQLFALAQGAKLLVLAALWPFAITRWGILGAASVFVVADWIVAPLFVGYVHRRFLGVDWAAYWEEACWRPITAGLGLGALALAAHSAIGSWLSFSAFGGAGMGLFAATGYWFLDEDAKALLRGWLKSKGRISWR